VKFRQGKNHWFLAHHLKISWGPPDVVYGMYQISGMYCTGALIPGFRGIFMVQKDKTFTRHKKHTWVEVFNKNLWQSERQFPDKGRSQWITSELNY
jgi:hypothetical protein